MTDTLDQRTALVEAITAEVLAALGAGGAPGTGTDPCASCLRGCAAQCSVKVREIVAGGASRVEFRGAAADVPSDLARYIDHTLLRPDAGSRGHRQALRRGRRVPLRLGLREPHLGAPLRGAPARQRRRGGLGRRLPLRGRHRRTSRPIETRRAIRDGAREIDMVINIGALKSGAHDLVREDIAARLGRLP